MPNRRVMFVLILSKPSTVQFSSVEDRPFAVQRNLPTSWIIENFGSTTSALRLRWRHTWTDGWVATVVARLMRKGERLGKTEGFCGYDWMIDNILRYGRTEACPTEEHHEWQPEREGWERCPRCRTSRKVAVDAS